MGNLVQMQSPHNLLVTFHSRRLGEAFRTGSGADADTGADGGFLRAYQGSGGGSGGAGGASAVGGGALELAGGYAVWQEVFSHMGLSAPVAKGGSQQPLLKQLLASLSLSKLLDAFCIARYCTVRGTCCMFAPFHALFLTTMYAPPPPLPQVLQNVRPFEAVSRSSHPTDPGRQFRANLREGAWAGPSTYGCARGAEEWRRRRGRRRWRQWRLCHQTRPVAHSSKSCNRAIVGNRP